MKKLVIVSSGHDLTVVDRDTLPSTSVERVVRWAGDRGRPRQWTDNNNHSGGGSIGS